MVKVSSGHHYEMGEPVWAHMDGYPWWPGRVVSTEEIIVDKGEKPPDVDADSCLVEFFNDNKRFAVMNKSLLKPFMHKKYMKLNMRYSGAYLDELNLAVREAREYAKDHAFSYIEAPKSTTNATGKKPVSPELKSESDEDVSKKKPKKRKMSMSTSDGERAKKKKKEKTGSSSDSAAKGKRKRKPPADKGGDSVVHSQLKEERKVTVQVENPIPQTDLPDGPVPRKAKRRRSPSPKGAVGKSIAEKETDDKDRKALKASDREDDKLPKRSEGEERKSFKVKVKVRKEMLQGLKKEPHAESHKSGTKGVAAEKGGDDKVSDVVVKSEEPSKAIKRKGAAQSREKKHESQSKDKRHESQIKDKKHDLITKDKKHELPSKDKKHELPSRDKKQEAQSKDRKHEAHSKDKKQEWHIKDKKVELKMERSSKAGPSRKQESAKVEERFQIIEKSVHEGPLEAGSAYQDLSKEQLIDLVCGLEKEIRAYRLEVWKLQGQTKECSMRSMKEVFDQCAPAFKAFDRFIKVCEKEGSKAERNEAEQHAIENGRLLLQLYMSPAILMNDKPSATRLIQRAIKLASRALFHSVRAGRVMREVVVQWVEMAVIENMSSEYSSSEQSDKADDEASSENKEQESEEEPKRVRDEVDERVLKENEGQVNRVESGEVVLDAGKGDDEMDVDVKEEASEEENGGISGEKEGKDQEKAEESMKEEGEVEEKGNDKEEVKDKEEMDEELKTSESPGTGTGEERNVDEKEQSPSDKTERRIKEFSRVRCLGTMKIVLRPMLGSSVAGLTLDEEKLEGLAGILEGGVEPRREEDMKGYYDAARAVLKVLSRKKEARDIVLKFVSRTDCRKECREFVRRCVCGEFQKDDKQRPSS